MLSLLHERERAMREDWKAERQKQRYLKTQLRQRAFHILICCNCHRSLFGSLMSPENLVAREIQSKLYLLKDDCAADYLITLKKSRPFLLHQNLIVGGFAVFDKSAAFFVNAINAMAPWRLSEKDPQSTVKKCNPTNNRIELEKVITAVIQHYLSGGTLSFVLIWSWTFQSEIIITPVVKGSAAVKYEIFPPLNCDSPVLHP